MADGIRSLAAGRTKLVVLTTAPADPKAPTLTELNAGVDISCRVKGSSFKAGPTDSEKVDSDLLCEDVKSQAFGQSNYELEYEPYRYWDPTTKQFEAGTTGADVGDKAFQLVKEKGTHLHYYIRRTIKKSKEAFAAGDEVIYLAGANDWPQFVEGDGYQSRLVKVAVDAGEMNAQVAAGA